MGRAVTIDYDKFGAIIDCINNTPDLKADLNRRFDVLKAEPMDVALLQSMLVIAVTEWLDGMAGVAEWTYAQFAAVAMGVDVDPVSEMGVSETFGKTFRFLITELLKCGDPPEDLCHLVLMMASIQAQMVTVADDGEPEPPTTANPNRRRTTHNETQEEQMAGIQRLRETHTSRVVVPTGTQMIVPRYHEYEVIGFSVLPNAGWSPPGRRDFDAGVFGDVALTYGNKQRQRRNALTSMDRYWRALQLRRECTGQLDETLLDLGAVLLHAFAAVEEGNDLTTATDRIGELRAAIAAAREEYLAFYDTISGALEESLIIPQQAVLGIKHLAASGTPAHTGEPLPDGSLNVELIIAITRDDV